MPGKYQHVDIGVIHTNRRVRDHLRGVDEQVGAHRVHYARDIGQRGNRAGNVARPGNRNVINAIAVLVDYGLQLVHIERTVALEFSQAGNMHHLRGMMAMRQIVGMMFHFRNQYHVALRARARQAGGHAVEPRGGAAAGKKTAVVLWAGVDELEYLFVCPLERLRCAACRVVQVGVGAGVVFEKFVTDLVGRSHHQRGCRRIQVDAWATSAVDGWILGITSNKFSLQAGQ